MVEDAQRSACMVEAAMMDHCSHVCSFLCRALVEVLHGPPARVAAPALLTLKHQRGS